MGDGCLGEELAVSDGEARLGAAGDGPEVEAGVQPVAKMGLSARSTETMW